MRLKDFFSISNIPIESNKTKYKLVKLFGLRYVSQKLKNLCKPKLLDDKDIEFEKTKNVYDDYLSIAVIAKNEAPYIKEWIEFHKLIGVDRIYFYDNESDDNTKEIIKPYIEDGFVVYHYVKGRGKQIQVYQDAIFRYKNNTFWLAIIDMDEFIVPVEKDNIKDFLKSYEKYPGIAINWLIFDSNGHKTKPDKLVIESYTKISKIPPRELTIKSIINPKKVDFITSPHFAFFKNSELPVNEEYVKNPEDGYAHKTKARSVNKVQINHYQIKSLEEYEKRLKLGRADTDEVKYPSTEYLNFEHPVENLTIQRFLPKLRKQMRLD